MLTAIRAALVLSLALCCTRVFSTEQPAAEPDAQVVERATERLLSPQAETLPDAAPAAVPETVIEQPLVPTRNFGPTIIERPQVSVSVTANPYSIGAGFGVYPVGGFGPYPVGGFYGAYGPYYRSYYIPPVYRYGYYYHRPWYYGFSARYPSYLRAPHIYPYAPPAAYMYGLPAMYPYPGAYVW